MCLPAVRAAVDGDNKENLIQRGSTLSLENWSHIVKTAIRSCRCGVALLLLLLLQQVERARSGHESQQDDDLQQSPGRSTLHMPDGRPARLIAKTTFHFHFLHLPARTEGRGRSLTERHSCYYGRPTSKSLPSLFVIICWLWERSPEIFLQVPKQSRAALKTTSA